MIQPYVSTRKVTMLLDPLILKGFIPYSLYTHSTLPKINICIYLFIKEHPLSI